MNEKSKNIVVLVISFVFAMFLGYIIMYIKTPSKNNSTDISNKTVEEINYSNYLYDIDGDNKHSTSAKILSDNSIFLLINNKEYTISNLKEPQSVRVCNTTKDGGYNMIYILSDGKLYYVSDTEYINRINIPPKTTKDKKGRTKKTNVQVFDEAPFNNIVAFSVISDYDSDSGYKYPTVYLKTDDGNIYVSKFGRTYKQLEKE
jgi:hypothetical protein